MNEPKLRFKADDGSQFPDWEEKKLGDITEKVVRKDANSNADVRMISQGNGFILQSDKYSRENAGQSLKKYTLLKRDEFAYNHGASKVKPYGVCYRLCESDEARVPYVYHTFKLIDGDSVFWNYSLNTSCMDRQLKKMVSSGARMDGLLNIGYDAYMSVDIHVPSLPEQQKIAEFLSTIDTVIEKQKETVSAWEERKKGVMQKLFNQEVRFKADDKSNLINWSSSDKQIDKEKITILCELLNKLRNEQTLIYCSTPTRARRMAKVYLEYMQRIGREKNNQLPLVEWINNNVSPKWSLAKELQYGVAIHDGSLQKHIGASIIKYFNEGRLNCIFCTSTIIEGVNTSAKNVILFDEKKGGHEIDFFDYSNIKGRSGRMMEHYVGRIFNFCHVPVQKSIVIDIPFYEQDPEILTDEILINIKKNEVKQEVRNRYDHINALPADLLSIIKQNGVYVNGQIDIYNKLISGLESKSILQNIQWSQLPTWDQMYYVLQLAENNLFNFKSKRGVFSVKQLARYLNMYRTKKNIIDIVNDIYNSKIATVKTLTDERKAKYYDEAIETAFHIYRHWFQFTVPKAFRVVDSIQRLICEKRNIKPGSYSFFVQQLENDFIRENLSILVEFGIPSNAVRRLENVIPANLSEDEVIDFIKKNRNNIQKKLLPYESERLEECI